MHRVACAIVVSCALGCQSGDRDLPAPAGSGSATTPQGTLDHELIVGVISRSLSRTTACYEREVETRRGLAGTTTVELTIKTDGRVGNHVATGFDPRVDACVADVIAKLVFPRPIGGSVTVTHRFTFSPPD